MQNIATNIKSVQGIFKEGVHDSSPQLYRMNCNKSYEVEMQPKLSIAIAIMSMLFAKKNNLFNL